MSTTLVTWPDVERLVVDYLLEHLEGEATVAVGVPHDWHGDEAALPHLDVGTDNASLGVATSVVVVRLRARARSTTAAKALAARAAGILAAHPGTGTPGTIGAARALTGPIAARDPDTRSELAATTVRVVARSQPPA